MEHKIIKHDLDILLSQLTNLKIEFDKGIQSGKCFNEVKVIHFQIKELSRLIENLQKKNDRGLQSSVYISD